MVPVFRLIVALILQVQAPVATPQLPSVERFQRVDAKLYRGAQPDANGFRSLHDLGIETVINLRSEQDEMMRQEQQLVRSLGMRYISLPVADGNFFTRSRVIPEDTIRNFFLAVDAATGPVFVHCRRGADRTGTLVALYRIARHGWDNERAYAEARELGMRSWYSGFKQQILAFTPGPDHIASDKRP